MDSINQATQYPTYIKAKFCDGLVEDESMFEGLESFISNIVELNQCINQSINQSINQAMNESMKKRMKVSESGWWLMSD